MVVRNIILLILLIPAHLWGATLSLNTAHYPPRSTLDSNGFEDLIVREAFSRIGHNVNIIHLPSERCLVNANNGINDGNFARVAGLEKIYPNLVMVPEPITFFEFAVFSKKYIPINGWDSLKPYRTGVVTGWKILEKHLGTLPMLKRATDQASLFDMLEKGHIDAAVFDLTEGTEILRQRKGTTIKPLKPLLDRQPMHIYLHRRHASLANPLTGALKEMKRDGTFNRISAEFNQ